MDQSGKITVPTGAKIVNHVVDKGIKVTDIQVNLQSDWNIASIQEDFEGLPDNSKDIAMSLRGDELEPSGGIRITPDNWIIYANTDISLDMQVKLPRQTTEGKITLASAEFTFDWVDGSEGGGGNEGGGGDTDPPIGQTHTISIQQGENGKVSSTSSIETDESGKITSFPSTTPDPGYIFDHWEDTQGNIVTTDTIFTGDTTIKPVFIADTVTPSPANWFTTNGVDTITGLSDEYLGMIDAPTTLIIPEAIGGTTITKIGNSAFRGKNLLTKVIVPKSITTVDTDAFSGCSNAQIYFEHDNVNYIKGSLNGVKEIYIPSIMQGGLAGIAGGICSGATVYTGSDSEYKLLEGQDKVKDDIIYVSEYGYALDNSNYRYNSGDVSRPSVIKTIKTVEYPYSVNGVVTQYPYGIHFGNNDGSQLQEIILPSNINTVDRMTFYPISSLEIVTPLEDIKIADSGWLSDQFIIKHPDTTDDGYTDFYVTGRNKNMIGYTSGAGLKLDIPATFVGTDGVSYKVVEICNNAFAKKSNITSVIIPNTVTRIGRSSFAKCTGLTSVEIPSSVKVIDSAAFNFEIGTSSLTNINIPDTVETIGSDAFNQVPHITYNGTATGAPWGALSIN